MKEITVKTQKELDKIKPDFKGTLYIEGGEQYSPLELSVSFDEARVIVRGEAWVKLWGSSHAELWGSSHAELRESSHAVLRESSHAVLWESSHAVLWESSHAVLWGSSHAELRGSSHAVLWGSSHAELRGSSVVKLFGESMVTARSAKEIIAKGYNVISVRKSDQTKMDIVMNKDSYLKVTPDFEPTFKEYTKHYPVDTKGKKVIMYKAVHKVDDKYLSDWDRSFEYKIGGKFEVECDQKQDDSCSYGLHVSHKSWAIAFGLGWKDAVILECEVPIDKIVVSKDTDGKVRTSELKVIRELPQDEWYDYES